VKGTGRVSAVEAYDHMTTNVYVEHQKELCTIDPIALQDVLATLCIVCSNSLPVQIFGSFIHEFFALCCLDDVTRMLYPYSLACGLI
jgi:hypothetical protein